MTLAEQMRAEREAKRPKTYAEKLYGTPNHSFKRATFGYTEHKEKLGITSYKDKVFTD
jgi:hypothetical protein